MSYSKWVANSWVVTSNLGFNSRKYASKLHHSFHSVSRKSFTLLISSVPGNCKWLIALWKNTLYKLPDVIFLLPYCACAILYFALQNTDKNESGVPTLRSLRNLRCAYRYKEKSQVSNLSIRSFFDNFVDMSILFQTELLSKVGDQIYNT